MWVGRAYQVMKTNCDQMKSPDYRDRPSGDEESHLSDDGRSYLVYNLVT